MKSSVCIVYVQCSEFRVYFADPPNLISLFRKLDSRPDVMFGTLYYTDQDLAKPSITIMLLPCHCIVVLHVLILA